MPLESVKLKCLSQNEPLCRHSSFKIGGVAQYFARPDSEENLRESIDFANSEKLPWCVIGGGCNILFSDGGFRGVVISTAHLTKGGYVSETASKLCVPAGLTIPRLGRLCRENGLSGLEFLSQIPGTTGGAVVMNAGFSRFGDRSQCIGPFVEEVRVLTKDGSLKSLKRENLEFRYRWSNLEEYIVLSVVFSLRPGNRENIEEDMKQNYRYRMSVQDLKYPSAGSVFKNPAASDLTVGKMVQNLGLRGKRIGDAQISDLHGNWIVNVGQARAKDVLELIRLIQDRVFQHYGVRLELEIKKVGAFDE